MKSRFGPATDYLKTDSFGRTNESTFCLVYPPSPRTRELFPGGRSSYNSLMTGKQCDIDIRMDDLNKTEMTIIKALGNETLTVEELAVKAGYEVSGYFRRTISSLRKRGILANKRPGYYLRPDYHYLLQDSIDQ